MQELKSRISSRLRELMQQENLSQRQLQNYLKRRGLVVSLPAINYWVNGLKAPTNKDNFDKLCKILEISVDDYSAKFHSVEQRRFALLGKVACGEPIWAEEDRDCFVMANSDIQADFCLICKGDSMLPLVHDGDIVFVKKQDSVNNGEVAVVIIENEATLKRVYQEQNRITLVAENKAYAPIVVLASENKSIHICGRAVFYQSLIK